MVHSGNRNRTQFVVLPPPQATVSRLFRNVAVNRSRYEQLLAGMQRFRGHAYLNDGAIKPGELTHDGRHDQPIDNASWHVLSLDEDGEICACLRYLEENQARGFDDLWVRHSALSGSAELGSRFRRAIETEMRFARQHRLGFGEVGGWAVSESHRWTVEPLRIILATYGLLELLGGCIGVATATLRHGSATILRRIGLSSLAADGAELPPYYDPQFECEMEVLKFDSRSPNRKYRDWVVELASQLTAVPVICRERANPFLPGFLPRIELPAAEPALTPPVFA